jgi:hypothetical protein
MIKTNNEIMWRDSKKIFELNPDMIIKTEILEDGIPIVIIDNFYKYPELVRQLCFEIPVSFTTEQFDTGFTGRRGNLMSFNDSATFYVTLSKILLDRLKLKSFINTTLIDDRQFVCNIYNENENKTNWKRICLPHSDTGVAAVICYLNKEEEGDIMGTAFYKHVESGMSSLPSSELQLDWYCKLRGFDKTEYYDYICSWREKIWDHTKQDYRTFTLESNSEWKIIGKTTGSYNSVVAYAGGILHSALIDYDKLKKNPYTRLNQIMFLHAPRELGGRPELSYGEGVCVCGHFELGGSNRQNKTADFLDGTNDAFKDLPKY